MKSHTDISQSKKLAEILSIESADMMYHSVEDEYGSGAFVATSKIITNGLKNDDFHIDDIPCWSLAALLSVLPNVIGYYCCKTLGWLDYDYDWYCAYVDEDDKIQNICIADNPVDACVEMILKLHELKML